MALLGALGGGYKTKGKIVPVTRKRNPHRPTRPLPKPKVVRKPGMGHQGPLQAGGGVMPPGMEAAYAPSAPPAPPNPEGDPVLMRIRALGKRSVDQAKSDAAAARKQAILESGLGDVGAELGIDAATAQAARDNPFSQRAEIERAIAERQVSTTDSLNQQGGFYSSRRRDALGDLETDRARQQTELIAAIRGRFGDIGRAESDAEIAAADAYTEGELDWAANLPAPPEVDPVVALPVVPLPRPRPHLGIKPVLGRGVMRPRLRPTLAVARRPRLY